MPSTRLVTVGEAVLESVIEGAGEMVVLLPAGPAHVSCLAPLAQRLAAAGFGTVAVNFRGVGTSTGPLDGLTLHHLAADRPDLVRRVVLLAAGGLVPTDPEARRVADRLRHETPTEAERLALRQAAYLSPASDPCLLAQVESSPRWAAGDLTETVSRAPPLADWWPGAARRSSWSRGWTTAGRPRQRLGAPRPSERPVRVMDIPRAGHFLVLEQPLAVAEAVTAFLREP